MEKKGYWTRIRKDVAKDMCANINQLMWGIQTIQREIGASGCYPITRNEESGDMLLWAHCTEGKYTSLRFILKGKFPGLCEFDVKVEE